MTNFTLGKYVPYNSLIHRLDARVKLLSMVIFMVMMFLKSASIPMNSSEPTWIGLIEVWSWRMNC